MKLEKELWGNYFTEETISLKLINGMSDIFSEHTNLVKVPLVRITLTRFNLHC